MTVTEEKSWTSYRLKQNGLGAIRKVKNGIRECAAGWRWGGARPLSRFPLLVFFVLRANYNATRLHRMGSETMQKGEPDPMKSGLFSG